MTAHVEINPELLVWARQRSGLGFDKLVHRFPRLAAWELGEQMPTFKQLENFAQATYAPIGYFFLPEPPEEQVPIPDYRTMGDTGVRRPSADLLDTIYQCQQRQDWYRDYAILTREMPVTFVGSLTIATPVQEAASVVRAALRFGVDDRGSTWADTFRILVERAESIGFPVMVNGVVGSNTHRKLNPREFRGFALVDDLAPLVFVNGSDTKAAQIFTLVHELAHLWLGGAALDDVDVTQSAGTDAERWCNQVAAEVLLPLTALPRAPESSETPSDWIERFFNTQPVCTGKTFTRAVVASTLESQTLYRDALQMLGIKKVATLHELASRLGIG